VCREGVRPDDEESRILGHQRSKDVAVILVHELLVVKRCQPDRHGLSRVYREWAFCQFPHAAAQFSHNGEPFTRRTSDSTVSGLVAFQWDDSCSHLRPVSCHAMQAKGSRRNSKRTRHITVESRRGASLTPTIIILTLGKESDWR
jgi:hypothetical protein